MSVRKMAVSGAFYPDNGEDLRYLFDQWHQQAEKPRSAEIPRVLILPHAGYVYSGATAFKGYQLWQDASSQIETVVVMGPAHRMYFEGIAALSADKLDTPLGDLAQDTVARDVLLGAFNSVTVLDQAHVAEHSLEVHLPFIKHFLPGVKVLPLLNGAVSAAEVTRVLQRLWQNPKVYFVISSDLSHFHSYAQAQQIDQETAQMVRHGEAQFLNGQRACGYKGIQGVLGLQSQQHLQIEQLELLNSGDTAGDKSRVVGYGAWAVYEGKA